MSLFDHLQKVDQYKLTETMPCDIYDEITPPPTTTTTSTTFLKKVVVENLRLRFMEI